jgi:RND family efflux transporter MFP subunit
MRKVLVEIGRIALTLVFTAAAIWAGWYLWQEYELEPWTRDGRVRADIVQVTPDVSGLVTDVMIHENQLVHKGQVLFLIDQPRYQLALQQAEAAVQHQQALVDEAKREDKRNQTLGNLVSVEVLQQGATRLAEAEAALAQAVTARDLAKLNLDRTTVIAPVNGILANVQLEPGDYATAGHPIFALVDTDSLHVDGYFEETKLPRIHIGDRATVQLMGSSQKLDGHVESISGGIEDRERGASANLLPNVNPTFSWVRLAQRIPVRVVLDKPPADFRLVAGRTATVTVLQPERQQRQADAKQ